MSRNGAPKDPEDFFADTRMSFGDHIEELRTHLWRALAGFGVALFFSFFIGKYVVDFIKAPVQLELSRFHDRRVKELLTNLNKDPDNPLNQPTPFTAIQVPRRQLAAIAKGQSPDMPRPVVISKEEQEARRSRARGFTLWNKLSDWWKGESEAENPADREKPVEISEEEADQQLVTLWIRYKEPLRDESYRQAALRELLQTDNVSTLNVQEGFMVWVKVCMVCGVVIGSPWIFWQIWAFVAAGLYPQEKRLVHVYLPISLGLFLAGVFVCELFVIPKAVEALLWFNEWLGLKPDMRLSEWLGFAIFMPLVFGVSFQTPLVMLFLARLGIVDVDTFRNKRKLAWFGLAVFAAVITPSTDALSMLFLWVPMSLLFELGIVLIKLTPREHALDIDVPEPDEMVEV